MAKSGVVAVAVVAVLLGHLVLVLVQAAAAAKVLLIHWAEVGAA